MKRVGQSVLYSLLNGNNAERWAQEKAEVAA